MTAQQKKFAYLHGIGIVLATLAVTFTLSGMAVQNMVIIGVSVATAGFFVLRPHFTTQADEGDQHDTDDPTVTAAG